MNKNELNKQRNKQKIIKNESNAEQNKQNEQKWTK